MNIIFLMTDQHRLDHAGFAGGAVETPNIDRIAESVGFTNCSTANPVCTPARSCLMTGRYSHQIGMVSMSGDLSLQHPTYARALQDAGYHTSGVGKFHLLQTWPWQTERGNGVNLVAIKDRMKEYGFDYLWEAAGKQLALKNYCDYCAYLDKRGKLEQYRDFVESAGPNTNFLEGYNTESQNGAPSPLDDDEYVDVVIADKIIERIIDRPKDKPFYIFGSFLSPHKPFDPPASYLDLVAYEESDDFITGDRSIDLKVKRKLWTLRRSYRAMIKLIDDQIGRIFSTLAREGLLQDTVVLFTSDHGEMLGDHLRKQKGSYYKQSVTVPTAIRHPAYASALRNASPVELTDLTATILDIAGLNPKEVLSNPWPAFGDRIPCRSLMPIVAGDADSVRDYAFSECNGEWEMIVDERWKYVRTLTYDAPGDFGEILFDLMEDPLELHNMFADPSCAGVLKIMQDRRDFVMDSTPPAQTSWAPLRQDRCVDYCQCAIRKS